MSQGALRLPEDLPRGAEAGSDVFAGVDIVPLAALAASLEAFGERFVARLYTAHEVAWSRANPTETVARFAARFAAKEAAIKALDLSEFGVDWRDLEVWREPGVGPRLLLHGRARVKAEELGVTRLAISLSHDGDHAGAVVFALARSTAARSNPLRPSPTTREGTPMSKNSDRIRAVLAQHGKLSADASTLAEDADLYQVGLTSHASVNVMLAVEGEFDVVFPDHLLTRSVFSSIAAIEAAVSELSG